MSATATMSPADILAAVTAFLFEEAALLDQRRWFDWLELFTPDGMYWAPLRPDQPDPINHVSLFYEDAMMREVRARRLEEKRAWSQQPQVHAARIVGNIRLGTATVPGETVVHSTFLMAESRLSLPQRLLSGFYTHRLLPRGDGFAIVEKRIDLIDSEEVHATLEAFL
ncbi:aromatic-ring-hydroxylating dioxygenase subunit beta [Sphingomonas flavalba]|uniref:aromatic-ring-hydroxylating dioxygenase subunit beta n=1 Tax=Sphingomonas flavalba TaxID=2559804 RepID=UPI001EF0F9A4|nr:aromatic-ring-hydroxylating dioxygenase subunit beta [Sphingomonas flavalba]